MTNTNKMKLIGKWMKNYMYHESSPLFDIKMPKPCYLNGNPKGKPLASNCNISHVDLFQRSGILIFMAQCFMLVLELMSD
jgi:hypothetical protein